MKHWFKRLLPLVCLPAVAMADYQVGLGIYDITGPAAELNMMGYGQLDQNTTGLHQRLRSRAFIVKDEHNKQVVFVSADLGMLTQSIQQGVVKKLKTIYGTEFSDDNVMLSATHTHSGPGAYAFHTLYNITAMGFNEQNYRAIVDGIVESIANARDNLEPGDIQVTAGELNTVSKNRSLESYQRNDEVERLKYDYPYDTEMLQFNFKNKQGDALGIFNWFPLHGVSMSNRNHLISGDNKGYASYLFEKAMQTDYRKKKTFVAAFAQANEGDVSPNIHQVEDDPNADEFARTQEEGEGQFKTSLKLFQSNGESLNGIIDYRLAYIDMGNQTIVDSATGQTKTTCPAALGYAFAAGTSDGRGPDIFEEGDLKHKPFIDMVTNMLVKPTQEIIDCQLPKPILLTTGITTPYSWTPNVVPVQLVRIGSIVLAGVPGEFTTMAGRRLKDSIAAVFKDDNVKVVIAGLSNAYSGYTTTAEEYEAQRYEGGHTLFGKNALAAYQQAFVRIAEDMVAGRASDKGAAPIDLSDKQITLQTPVLFDDVPLTHNFGDVIEQPNRQYQLGDAVQVTFWGAHPKNDLKIQNTYLQVQKQVDHQWITVANDWDWDTIYLWQRYLAAYSKVKITWNIPKDAEKGVYRIVHLGNYKNGWDGKIRPYLGVSQTFEVL